MAASPLNIAGSSSKPAKPANASNMAWWPYSPSYQIVPAAIYRYEHIKFGQNIFQGYSTYSQSATHDSYAFDGRPFFGKRKFDDVRFSAQKMMTYDTHQRHAGKKTLFFAYAAASQPLLFFDGSVSTRKTADSNKGSNAATPDVPKSLTKMTYDPDPGFEAATDPNDPENKNLLGYYRWTRGGLLGVDYAGEDILDPHGRW